MTEKLPQPAEETDVPLDALHTDGENPNEQDEDTFSDLKRGMRDRGWVGGDIVANTGPLPGYDGDPEGLICDGEHRWRAADDIGLEEVPVTFIDFDDDAERRIWRQRLNKTTGEHDRKRDALEVDAIMSAGDYTEDLDSVMAAADQDIDELLAEIRTDTSEPPAYEYDPDHNVYFEDCVEGMAERLDDNSVDLVFTSPPYNVGLDQTNRSEDFFVDTESYDDEMSDEEYREFIGAVLDELERVVKPTGHVFFNIQVDITGGTITPPRWIIDRMPLPWRSYIVWNKDFAPPGSEMVQMNKKGRFHQTWEPVLHFADDPDPLSGNHNFAVWDVHPSQFESDHNTGDHPAPYPVELVEQALDAAADPGDVVLDPFMGSGTTAVAAIFNDCEYIGFELDPDDVYRSTIERRIGEAKRQRDASVNQDQDDTADTEAE